MLARWRLRSAGGERQPGSCYRLSVAGLITPAAVMPRCGFSIEPFAAWNHPLIESSVAGLLVSLVAQELLVLLEIAALNFR